MFDEMPKLTSVDPNEDICAYEDYVSSIDVLPPVSYLGNDTNRGFNKWFKIYEYAKLHNKEKLEWNNRGFSMFHSLVVAVVALYLLTVSDLFDIFNRSLSDALLGLFVKKKLGLTLSAFCSPTQTMASLVFGDGALPSKIDGQAHTSSKYSKLEQEMHELKLSMQRILSRFEKEDGNNVL